MDAQALHTIPRESVDMKHYNQLTQRLKITFGCLLKGGHWWTIHYFLAICGRLIMAFKKN